jgi:hypothetical protein
VTEPNKKRNEAMTYDETKHNLPTQHVDDGFDSDDDGSSRSIIKGAKIKFTNNAEWLDASTDEVISPEQKFIVIQIVKVTQKWIEGRPQETRILATGLPFPDVEKLNAEAPRSEWREHFGKMEGPWQNSYVVYLLDPRTMGGFTFPTSTVGGMRAVHELKEATRRARMLHGPGNYPVVTLSDVHMNTQFGGRSRPCFKILRFWTENGGTKESPALSQQQPEQLGSDNQKKPLNELKMGSGDLDDEIPF